MFFSGLPQQRVAQRYTVGVAVAILAVVVRGLLDPVLGHVAFYATVYMGVAFCAVVCGFGPAALSAVLGFLGTFYWFVDPRHSLAVNRVAEVHGIIGFFLVCSVLIGLGATNRNKELTLARTIAALKKEAGERLHAEEQLRAAHDELEERVRQRTAELSVTLSRLETEVEVRQQAEQELRYLSVQLMTLQDEERRRIARELHDSAGQTLAAIKMTLACLESPGAMNGQLPGLIEDLNVLADSALQEIRTTSYLLHPPLLDEAGIASAARWFVEGFAKRSGIRVHCDIARDLERPPRECELVLFRVLQESLTNVHRHSGASDVSVTLHCENGQLQLEVSDNGHGIPGEVLKHSKGPAAGKGVGIAGMQERVREIGGHFEIRPGKTGTIVTATLPASATRQNGPQLWASAG